MGLGLKVFLVAHNNNNNKITVSSTRGLDLSLLDHPVILDARADAKKTGLWYNYVTLWAPFQVPREQRWCARER